MSRLLSMGLNRTRRSGRVRGGSSFTFCYSIGREVNCRRSRSPVAVQSIARARERRNSYFFYPPSDNDCDDDNDDDEDDKSSSNVRYELAGYVRSLSLCLSLRKGVLIRNSLAQLFIQPLQLSCYLIAWYYYSTRRGNRLSGNEREGGKTNEMSISEFSSFSFGRWFTRK